MLRVQCRVVGTMYKKKTLWDYRILLCKYQQPNQMDSSKRLMESVRWVRNQSISGIRETDAVMGVDWKSVLVEPSPLCFGLHGGYI